MLPLNHLGQWRIAGALLPLVVLGAAMAPAIWPWSENTAEGWFEISDKWLHAITFAFLAIWYSGQYARQAYWRIAIGLLMFGALIEICQSLVTYRSAELGDLVADTVGIAVGVLIALIGIGGWSLRVETWLLQRNG